jgi:soluble epoxide hydrolase / lipid-phosphate phosphatase
MSGRRPSAGGVLYAGGYYSEGGYYMPDYPVGFYVAAADTTGYGQSFNSREVSDYSMESQVADQLELLSHLGREKAIFVGHDWGSAIIWSLAAHHPERCLGVAALGIPYRTVELGLGKLVSTVDRELYPETKYPYGQWDYMLFYEQIRRK